MSELENAQDGAVVAPATQDSITEKQEVKQESTPVEDANPEAKKDTGFQKRINELTKSYRTTEREKEALASRVAELEALQQQAQTRNDPVAMPKLKDFDYDEDAHALAVEKYFENKATKTVEGYVQKQKQNETAAKQQEDLETIFQSHEKRAAEFAKATQDYFPAMEQLANVVQFAPEIGQVIGLSDKSPEILYYLANNLDEADRLAHMPIHLAAAQVARIEARLSSSGTKTISNAPPPTTQIKGGSVVATDPAKLSDADWYRQRQSKSK